MATDIMNTQQTATSIRIVAATADDIDAIIELIETAHGESRYAKFPFAQVRLRRFVRDFLTARAEDQATTFLVKHDEETVGLAACQILPHLFSTALIASTLLFFVKQTYRGGSAPSKLLRALTQWAQLNKAVELSVHVTRGEEEGATRINRFFKAKGFHASGENLHLDL